MDILTYAKHTCLHQKNELDKVALITYFFLKTNGKTDVFFNEISDWFHQLNFAKPNMSRLKTNIKKSKKFINGSIRDTFTLHAKEISRLNQETLIDINNYKPLVNFYEVLPHSCFSGTRGYLERLSDQINSSYENKVFDGCTVLMRRLLEILLIHSYEFNGIASAIQNAKGDYKLLNEITIDAKMNNVLQLSRNTKAHLDDFRKLGNFSAHKIHYNCKKEDIDRVIIDYRACIEELLYKAGIKK